MEHIPALNMFDGYIIHGTLACYIGFTEQEVKSSVNNTEWIWKKLRTLSMMDIHLT